ncbi:uncharacterized protein LOC101723434 isoform X2 [Heterocephalus glaber]|uniref:Uncharacterized protein LOC101723434 isoform X2 n=1 Tax=Heterocephalus glaber TaxID=10181 RepID=A0AAX6Q1Y0_HETGA|nr:uncharacterized protein LOC101723434 isoform X2 [Heterocephalus glaber]
MSGGSKVAPFTPPRSKHQFSRTAWSHTGSPRLAVPSLQGPPPGGEPGIERRAARAPKPRSACTRLPLSLVGSASVFRTGKDLYSCALAQNQEVAPVPVPVPGPVVAFVSGGQLSRLVLRNLAKMLRNLLALRQIAQRTISTASRRHFENKVPQKQKLFQELHMPSISWLWHHFPRSRNDFSQTSSHVAQFQSAPWTSNMINN